LIDLDDTAVFASVAKPQAVREIDVQVTASISAVCVFEDRVGLVGSQPIVGSECRLDVFAEHV
jgi:hypothetical protein